MLTGLTLHLCFLKFIGDPVEYRKATGGKPFAHELQELRKGLADGELDVSEHATAEGDLTWLGALSPASQACVFPSSFLLHAPLVALFNLQPQALFAFLEDFIYKGKFDGQIRNGLRRKQSVAEALQHADIKDLWEKVLGSGFSDDGNKKNAQGADEQKMMLQWKKGNRVYFHHCQIFDLPFLQH